MYVGLNSSAPRATYPEQGVALTGGVSKGVLLYHHPYFILYQSRLHP